MGATMRMTLFALAATGLGLEAAAAAQDDTVTNAQVYEACMVRVEALDYPDGVGPEIMEPNCQCVGESTKDAMVRRNLVETAAIADLENRALLTIPEAEQAIAACFDASTD